MATEVKEHEDRSHSARYLVLIFLVLVAMCGVFFSAGFIVGRNERSLHSAPPTEVVTTPGVVPPTVNPPPDTAAPAPGTNPAAPNTVPESEVIPPGPEAAPGPAAGKSPDAAPSAAQLTPKTDQAETPPSAAELGKGITLQVLAMHTKQDAESVVDSAEGQGIPGLSADA